MLNLSKREWEYDKKDFESLLKENKQNLSSEELEDLLTILK